MQYGESSLLDTLYYEVLPFTLKQMREKLSLEVVVLNAKQVAMFSGRVVVDKDAKCADLVAQAKKQAGFAVPASQALRVLIVANSRILAVGGPADAVEQVERRANCNLVLEFVEVCTCSFFCCSRFSHAGASLLTSLTRIFTMCLWRTLSSTLFCATTARPL